jgi:hypothetical protein
MSSGVDGMPLRAQYFGDAQRTSGTGWSLRTTTSFASMGPMRSATSMAPITRSSSRLLRWMLTCTSGWPVMKSSMCQPSRLSDRPCGAATRSRPRGCAAKSDSSVLTSWMRPNRGTSRCASVCPASVGVTERVDRFNRRTPTSFSSWATVLVTLALEMPKAMAARVKLLRAMTSLKTLSC